MWSGIICKNFYFVKSFCIILLKKLGFVMKISRFSRIGFILATAGSAVGLGNIWKFPYMTGEYGGGAFVLTYLITILLIGFAVLVAEITIGALGRLDTVSSFEKLSNNKNWKYAGFMGMNGLIIMIFYSVVIGWILHYIFSSIFYGLPENIQTAQDKFSNLIANEVGIQILWHTIATFIVLYFVHKGIKQGIEKLNIILMPSLIIILLGMLIYSMNLDGFAKSINFMFSPDWSKIDSDVIIRAIGHAFFTLSLGMGAIMTYSASLPKHINITKTALIVTFMDTIIALIAGLMIFAFLFEFGESPSKGPGLVFISMPVIFAQLGYMGIFFALIFFLALAFAGLTSAVSLVEPSVQYLITRLKISRLRATVFSGIFYYILGLSALLSYTSSWGEIFSISGTPLFDIYEFTTDSILLPLGGILMAIFVGYVLPKDQVKKLLSDEMGKYYPIWRFSIKFIAPISIFIMMLSLIGIL